ncbi:MAG: Fic family protein [Desulfovibrionales bacterium]
MPRKIPERDLDAIVQIVEHHPSGASIEQIRKALEIGLPRRTLQRRLALLVEQGRLKAMGSGPARRYLAPVPGKIELELPALKADLKIPISTDGEKIREHVHKPIQVRQPVGYNRELLDGYRPNHSTYLSETIRNRLDSCGRSNTDKLPAGTHAKKIYNRLLIDLSWNSSRLEGNTYSLLETEQLLQFGKSAEGKDAFETQMILNHKAAIDLLVDQAEDVGFNRYTVLNLHALLSDNLLSDPSACGRLRTIPVSIEGSVYHPLEVPQLIEECFQQILDTARVINDPFEQSFFMLVHLPYLQPFEDVNKRVSRLCANIPFIRANLSPLSFIDVPGHIYIDGLLGVYELNRFELLRDVFVWAYERSCARYAAVRKSLGDPDLFRMHHREAIKKAVATIVRNVMNRNEAAGFARQSSEALPPGERNPFIEVVETEIMGLHEGNIARYQLSPAEYRAWHRQWTSS